MIYNGIDYSSLYPISQIRPIWQKVRKQRPTAKIYLHVFHKWLYVVVLPRNMDFNPYQVSVPPTKPFENLEAVINELNTIKDFISKTKRDKHVTVQLAESWDEILMGYIGTTIFNMAMNQKICLIKDRTGITSIYINAETTTADEQNIIISNINKIKGT